MRVLALSGSLRSGSYNTRLLTALAQRAPEGVEVVRWRDLKRVPPYDQDDDGAAAPPAVRALRRAVEGADAVVIATPEYNHSIPGQLKNALDWLSRPLATSALRNKPVVVVGASTGAFGAVWAQAETRKALSAIGARVVDHELAVPHADIRLGADVTMAADRDLGELLDAALDALRAAVHERTVARAA